MDIQEANKLLEAHGEASLIKFDYQNNTLSVETNAEAGGPGEVYTLILTFDGVLHINIPVSFTVDDNLKITELTLEDASSIIGNLAINYDPSISEERLNVYTFGINSDYKYFVISYGLSITKQVHS